ncbi:hypothetical protein EDC01DRAFT_761944, partial [Geopyxis carbonaria]
SIFVFGCPVKPLHHLRGPFIQQGSHIIRQYFRLLLIRLRLTPHWHSPSYPPTSTGRFIPAKTPVGAKFPHRVDHRPARDTRLERRTSDIRRRRPPTETETMLVQPLGHRRNGMHLPGMRLGRRSRPRHIAGQLPNPRPQRRRQSVWHNHDTTVLRINRKQPSPLRRRRQHPQRKRRHGYHRQGLDRLAHLGNDTQAALLRRAPPSLPRQQPRKMSRRPHCSAKHLRIPLDTPLQHPRGPVQVDKRHQEALGQTPGMRRRHRALHCARSIRQHVPVLYKRILNSISRILAHELLQSLRARARLLAIRHVRHLGQHPPDGGQVLSRVRRTTSQHQPGYARLPVAADLEGERSRRVVGAAQREVAECVEHVEVLRPRRGREILVQHGAEVGLQIGVVVCLLCVRRGGRGGHSSGHAWW